MTDFHDGGAPEPYTRAERRSQALEEERSARAEARHQRRSRWRDGKVAPRIVGAVIILAIVFVGWLGFRVINAAISLTTVQNLAVTAQEQASSMDIAGLSDSVESIIGHASNAAAQTHDPVWALAEQIPGIGRNLTAVREITEVLDSVANDTVEPLTSVVFGLSPEALTPVDGRLNLEPLTQLSNAIGPATESFHAAAQKSGSINLDGTIGPVRDAGSTLSSLLTSVGPTVSEAAGVVQVLPELLGANGPRTYVLVFQNLAEATALGGSAAALTELNVDNGAISIGRQASSGDFPWLDGDPIIPPNPEAEAIFGPMMYERLNLSTSRPDFPTAGEIAQAFWQEYVGGDVDAVISIDPVALSHLLNATGPIAMSTGDTLTSDNAVSLLLNEVYFRYQDNIKLSDAFFAEAARSVFNGLMAPTTDVPKLALALSKGVSERRIMAWSANPELQTTLAASALSGILPTTNEKSTTVGVYFRDMSASKMDYYLKSYAKLSTDVCTASAPTFTTTIALRSDITPELASTLPDYVASEVWGAEKFRTQVFVYGPPGTTLVSGEVLQQGVLSSFDQSGNDMGRPVATFSVYLAPGQSSEITATFTGAAGAYAQPRLVTTPMLNPTTTALDSPGC